MASLILSNCKQAILVSFIIAPILCFPTYFVFRINEKRIVEEHGAVSLYHLDVHGDTALYRSVTQNLNVADAALWGGFKLGAQVEIWHFHKSI